MQLSVSLTTSVFTLFCVWLCSSDVTTKEQNDENFGGGVPFRYRIRDYTDSIYINGRFLLK